MAIGPATSATTDWYLTALANYGQGPVAPLATSNGIPAATDTSVTSASPSASAADYTPSAAVEQALSAVNASLASDYSNLFSAGKSSSSSSGFVSAIGMSADLAIASYANTLNGIPSTTAMTAASEANGSSTGASTTSPQSAIQAAQASVFASTLNLLG